MAIFDLSSLSPSLASATVRLDALCCSALTQGEGAREEGGTWLSASLQCIDWSAPAGIKHQIKQKVATEIIGTTAV